MNSEGERCIHYIRFEPINHLEYSCSSASGSVIFIIHLMSLLHYLPGEFFRQMGLAAKPQTAAAALQSGKATIKIGRPGYRVTKARDPESTQRTLGFEVDYPEAEEGVQPRHRFMSAYEQRVEAPDKNYQYLLVACEPYETVHRCCFLSDPNACRHVCAEKFLSLNFPIFPCCLFLKWLL